MPALLLSSLPLTFILVLAEEFKFCAVSLCLRPIGQMESHKYARSVELETIRLEFYDNSVAISSIGMQIVRSIEFSNQTRLDSKVLTRLDEHSSASCGLPIPTQKNRSRKNKLEIEID